MLKKTLVMLGMCLMLMVSVVSAESQDTENILSKFSETRLYLEAGINKIDYQRQYRDLYMIVNKNKNNVDPSDFQRFKETLEYYEDIGRAWETYGTFFYPDELKNKFGNKYPEMKTEVYRDMFGRYDKESVVSFLFSKANNKERALEKYFNDKKKNQVTEQQKQEKTAE